MSRFLFDARLEIAVFVDPTDGRRKWVTSRNLGFVYGDETTVASYATFIVPPGFETDLGTIPWWARWLFNPSDPAVARCYVLHDYINKLTQSRPPGPGVWSSQAAAAVLYEAMALDGVSLWRRKIQFLGVVLGIAKSEW